MAAVDSSGRTLVLVRTVTTTRAAAVSALEVILRGEDHVWPFHVVVAGFERDRLRFG